MVSLQRRVLRAGAAKVVGEERDGLGDDVAGLLDALALLEVLLAAGWMTLQVSLETENLAHSRLVPFHNLAEVQHPCLAHQSVAVHLQERVGCKWLGLRHACSVTRNYSSA